VVPATPSSRSPSSGRSSSGITGCLTMPRIMRGQSSAKGRGATCGS
jgi:hypothetical protein